MQKDNPMLDLEIQALFANTPLEKFINALISEQFTPPPNDPIKKNDEIIGELSDFEKALFTAMEQTAQEHNSWVMQNISRAEFTQQEKASSANGQNNHRILEDLLWASIKQRIGAVACQEEYSISIHENYKIILTPPPPKSNPSCSSFKDIMDAVTKGELDTPNVKIHIIGHSPDCADCPDRQGCALPIKDKF